ncbi:hypothetical protein KILIM_005_01120 [Kineosphaera limosa NBRC 100340]|uniref:DUF3099 domain-containing protein n=1 Tax=Kineosphaera limosa NBRC 100340 TaxID=1184609 RepID=K6W5P5_9MICO|nr:DUF3099 domain-containing protein [Kineosphaera limosa]GAB94495.1 hypothetical protein KILIM_005_01120 [Kineosphaera limosa NBRC 100340]
MVTYADVVRATLHRSRPKGPAAGSGGRQGRRAPTRPVHSITGAALSPRVDQNKRLRNYLISMGIRTVCFALAGVFAVTTSWTWLAWLCVVAAAVLPYPAVVFANAVDRRLETTDIQAPYRMLEAGPSGAVNPRSSSSGGPAG